MTAWIDDGDVQLYHGDVIQTLRSLPAGIAQTCVTSPPYWGLRDYGTGMWTGGDTDCDHKADAKPERKFTNGRGEGSGDEYAGSNLRSWTTRDAMPAGACGRCGARRVDSQLGLEATPTLYVERLVAVFREVWRVLRDDGTVWLNLGDSYNAGRDGGWAGGKGALNEGRDIDAIYQGRSGANVSGLKPKDLVGIPWRVAFALQTDGWYLRSDIVWSKPNPMPESVTDRPTKAHEYLFLLSKRPRYFYDADAIREELADPTRQSDPYPNTWDHQPRGAGNAIVPGGYKRPAAGARNRRSVWTIPTEPFPEAHFATYPQALVRPCIQAGTSERGECSSCGAPWKRETSTEYVKSPVHGAGSVVGRHYETGANGWDGSGMPQLNKEVTTTGWRASCTCDAPTRPQTVLDPFIGSGTTALVARNHGRRCIGIDLSAEYLAIAAKRLQQLSLLT